MSDVGSMSDLLNLLTMKLRACHIMSLFRHKELGPRVNEQSKQTMKKIMKSKCTFLLDSLFAET